MKGIIYSHTLDIRAFTSPAVSPHLERFLLAEDNAQSTYLSSLLFRVQRAIGGARTEYLRSDEELNHLAIKWAQHLNLPSARTCPFCKNGHSTPRHYVMVCTESEPCTSEVCDAVESELARLISKQQLIAAANKYHAASPVSFHMHHSSPRVGRWPILCAWRRLVKDPNKETLFYNSSSLDRKKPASLKARQILHTEASFRLRSVVLSNKQT